MENEKQFLKEYIKLCEKYQLMLWSDEIIVILKANEIGHLPSFEDALDEQQNNIAWETFGELI